MSDFSPFFRNRQSSGCSCDRSCLLHCTESLIQPHSRSSFRTLAHLSAFSLIFTRRFSIFLTKNAISVFLCYFMLIFQPAARMHYVNYSRFSLFERLSPASGHLQGTSTALQTRFRGASGSFGEDSIDSRTLTQRLTGQRRRPTRIKIDKSRFLFPFPEKRYVEKAPSGLNTRS